MPKYIITWNAGYGDTNEVIEVETEEEAQRYAYESWREEAESQASYTAEEYSEELAEELGL